MLAWTKQNTMQRAMRTVLEWPQSHETSKLYKYYNTWSSLGWGGDGVGWNGMGWDACGRVGWGGYG